MTEIIMVDINIMEVSEQVHGWYRGKIQHEGRMDIERNIRSINVVQKGN